MAETFSVCTGPEVLQKLLLQCVHFGSLAVVSCVTKIKQIRDSHNHQFEFSAMEKTRAYEDFCSNLPPRENYCGGIQSDKIYLSIDLSTYHIH